MKRLFRNQALAYCDLHRLLMLQTVLYAYSISSSHALAYGMYTYTYTLYTYIPATQLPGGSAAEMLVLGRCRQAA